MILTGLAAYLYFVELPGERIQEASENESKRVFQIDPATVTSVTLQYPDHQIHLTRTDDEKWTMDRPLKAGTDQREVESLIATIAEMERIRTIAESDTNPAAFGFSPPPLTIHLEMAGGSEDAIFGDDGPIPDTMYVKRGSTKSVALTKQWIRGSVLRTVFDLRDKSILSMDRDSVTKLDLDLPGVHLSFSKMGDRWSMLAPRSVPADRHRIEGLLGTLVNLRASAFVDDSGEREKIEGKFKTPALRADLSTDTEKATVSFYRPSGIGSVYAVRSAEVPLYQVMESLLDDFKPEVFYYQDKHLLLFDRQSVSRIEVRGPEESYTLTKSGDHWSMEESGGIVETGQVDGFFDHLEQLEAEVRPGKPAASGATGLEHPRWRIVLYGPGEQPVGRLALGGEIENSLYARGRPDLDIVTVNRNFPDEIPKKAELIPHQDGTKNGPS